MRTVKILIRERTCADWTLIRVRRCAACSDIHVYTETGKYMHCASIHQNVIACACIHARMRACLCHRHLHTDICAWDYTDVRMCVRTWIHAGMTHMHLCVLISIVIIIVITVCALNIGTPILFVISALKLKQDHLTTCYMFSMFLDDWQTVYTLISRRVLIRVFVVCSGLSVSIFKVITVLSLPNGS